MFKPTIRKYKEQLIVNREQGADLVDPVSGNWLHFKTARSAKWHASIIFRIQREATLHGIYHMPRNAVFSLED